MRSLGCLVVLCMWGCGGDSNPITPPPTPFPGTGAIQVATRTTGWNLDADGYRMTVDGAGRASLAPNGSKTVFGIVVGSRTIDLTGLDSNCVETAAGPLTVEVTLGGVVSAAFNVACAFSRFTGELLLFARAPSGKSELFITDVTGERRLQLTDAGLGPGEPRISPDGTGLAFPQKDAGTDQQDLFMMNADGTGLTNVTQDVDRFDGWPAWSPDGSRLVFQSQSYADLSDWGVFVVNVDGTGLTRVAGGVPGGEQAAWPDWSPDGSRILYHSDVAGTLDIWSVAPDGTGPLQLTGGEGVDECARWSRDGSRILFDSNRSGDYEMYIMNADGSGVTRLTDRAGFDTCGIWSPDGSQIAFTSHMDGQPGIIMRMNADGTGLAVFGGLQPDDNLWDWGPG